MTYLPNTWLEIRRIMQRETGLPAKSLGIQHYQPDGGGYHEGNDLLAKGGRLDSDYSKRESTRDRPGSDGASAIDIGWFDVIVKREDGSRVRVTLDTLTLFLLHNFDAPDALWIREIIYSLDRKTVRRKDRLGIRTSGDVSHLTHDHVSGFRDDENTPKAPLFERFWREVKGIGVDMSERLEWFADAFEYERTEYAGGPLKGREVKFLKDFVTLQKDVADMKATLAAIQSALQGISTGTGVDVQTIEDAAFRGAQRAERE